MASLRDATSLALSKIPGEHKYRSESEIRCHCPFHSDRTPSFDLNVDTGYWICRGGCGAGWIDKLLDLLGVSEVIIKSALSGATKPVPRTAKDPIAERVNSLFADSAPKIIDPAILAAYRRLPTSLLEDGFDREVLERFNVGYDQINGRIVFPIWDWDGNLVGVSGRGGDDEPLRYKIYEEQDFLGYAPSGYRPPRTEMLYGIHVARDARFGDPVFVCEGFKEVLRLATYGYLGVATLGASINEGQIRGLSRLVSRTGCVLILAMDNDAAGFNSAVYLGSRLVQHHPLVAFTPEVKDVSEVKTKNEIDNLVQQAEPYTNWRSRMSANFVDPLEFMQAQMAAKEREKPSTKSGFAEKTWKSFPVRPGDGESVRVVLHTREDGTPMSEVLSYFRFSDKWSSYADTSNEKYFPKHKGKSVFKYYMEKDDAAEIPFEERALKIRRANQLILAVEDLTYYLEVEETTERGKKRTVGKVWVPPKPGVSPPKEAVQGGTRLLPLNQTLQNGLRALNAQLRQVCACVKDTKNHVKSETYVVDYRCPDCGTILYSEDDIERMMDKNEVLAVASEPHMCLPDDESLPEEKRGCWTEERSERGDVIYPVATLGCSNPQCTECRPLTVFSGGPLILHREGTGLETEYTWDRDERLSWDEWVTFALDPEVVKAAREREPDYSSVYYEMSLEGQAKLMNVENPYGQSTESYGSGNSRTNQGGGGNRGQSQAYSGPRRPPASR